MLGSGQMLPDFEKALYGVKAGEEKTFKVKFPKDYQAEELQGKKVDFTVNVHRVEEEDPTRRSMTALLMSYGVERRRPRPSCGKMCRTTCCREAEQNQALRRQGAGHASGLLDANPMDVAAALIHQEKHIRCSTRRCASWASRIMSRRRRSKTSRMQPKSGSASACWFVS